MADPEIEYNRLYQLQDKVLEIIFSNASEFYLTGGTCLHRFYFNERYSDDLEFFTHDSPTFSFSIRELKIQLANQFQILIKVETRDFVRWIVQDNEQNLQIDFINDRVCRFVLVS